MLYHMTFGVSYLTFLLLNVLFFFTLSIFDVSVFKSILLKITLKVSWGVVQRVGRREVVEIQKDVENQSSTTLEKSKIY